MSTNRKRNMLEAFQASAKEAEGEHVPHTTGGAGGPFAEESRGTRRADKPEQTRAPVPESAFDPEAVPSLPQALARLPIGPIACALLLILVVTFWLGYIAGGTSTVAAKGYDSASQESDSRRRSDRNSNQPPPPTDGSIETLTPYNSRFFNLKATGFTLRVAAYDRSERNELLAWEAYDHLIDQRMPAVTPVTKSSSIFIFVGAEESISRLDQLKERVEALEGPQGGQPFAGAFPVNISDYVQ